MKHLLTEVQYYNSASAELPHSPLLIVNVASITASVESNQIK